MDQLPQRRLYGRQLPNNTPDSQPQTLGDRIKFKYERIFPLSLKKLVRIKIKHYMPDYSIKNVNKLEILPQTLKDFVLFKQEIGIIMSYKSRN